MTVDMQSKKYLIQGEFYMNKKEISFIYMQPLTTKELINLIGTNK